MSDSYLGFGPGEMLSFSYPGSGASSGVTAAEGSNNTQLATTAFVQEAVGGYLHRTGLTGGSVYLTESEVSNPVLAFSGTLISDLVVIVPNTTERIWAVYNSTQGPFSLTVKTLSGTGVPVSQGKCNLIYTDGSSVYEGLTDFNSISLTGTPTAPTAQVGTSTSQIATTAFVVSQILSHLPVDLPITDGVAAAGSSPRFAREDHVHPVDLTRAPIYSPALQGFPTSPTPVAGDSSTRIANTEFVNSEISAGRPYEDDPLNMHMDGVASAGSSSTVARGDHVHPTDISRAPVSSPSFTGVPTAPTAVGGTNTTQIATTEYVVSEISRDRPFEDSSANIKMDGAPSPGTSSTVARGDHTHPTDTSRAPVSSPSFTGSPTAPTAVVGTNSTQLATTAFVINEIANDRPFESTALNIKMDGTQSVGTLNTVARGDHVHPTDTSRAPLASPSLTGTPTAPTAAVGTNTTQLATTAFVVAEISNDRPFESTASNIKMDGTQSVGTLNTVARGDHVHPTDTSRAPVASPALTGIPTAPTAAVGTSTTQLATTAFVNAEIDNDRPFEATAANIKMDGTQSVGTLNTVARGDHVHPTDTSRAPVASPAFTGTPTAPTAAIGTNTTQVATTAFVQSSVGGYLSKPGLTGGTVTLTAAEASNLVIALSGSLTSDLTVVVPTTVKKLWAIYNSTTGSFSTTVKTATGTGIQVYQGRCSLAFTDGTNVYPGFTDFNSVSLTGTPTAPTAIPGTNTTQIATTEFVGAAISGGRPLESTDTNILMDGIQSAGVSTSVARGDHVHPTDTSRAPVASPALTGTPTAPTAAVGTNTTQLATTAFVVAEIGNDRPFEATAANIKMDGTQSVGTLNTVARGDHVHPTDTSRAPIASPALTGTPTAPTAAVGTNTTQLATTAFVSAEINNDRPFEATAANIKMDGTQSVGTLNTVARGDHVHPTDTSRAPIASPALTGTPTAPTAAVGTNTTQLATTAFVVAEISNDRPFEATAANIKMDGTQSVGTLNTVARGDHVHPTDTSRAPVASPALTGTPTAPTAAVGTNTTQLATTAFVQGTVGGYLSKSGLTGGTVTLTATEASSQIIALSGTLTSNLTIVVPASPNRIVSVYNNTSGAFSTTVKTATGTGVNVTQGRVNLLVSDGTNVYSALNDLDSVAITGTPTAPTAAVGTNSTQLATTAFVVSEIANDRPFEATVANIKMDGTQSVGTLNTVARGDHVHPTDTSRAPLSSPSFIGTPTAPTASVGTSTTQIATTAFVSAEINNDRPFEGTATNIKMDGAQSVGTLNTVARGDHVHPTDTTRAPLASPSFTGTPTAPTAAVGNSSTQIATTAFVNSEIANDRPFEPTATNIKMNGTQSVGTLNTVARGDHVHPVDTSRAPLVSPSFTGTPTAPTATLGTNTTQIATTAFVQSAISGVASSSTDIDLIWCLFE